MEPASVGRDFAAALADKDFERAGSLLDPEVDFRALTPNRAWEASGASQVVAEVLPLWLEESDHVEELLEVESGAVSDRQRVSYQLRGHNDDGPFIVEQQAYFTESDGRIDWIRVLCSGLRPA
jgi:hypothetical protein